MQKLGVRNGAGAIWVNGEKVVVCSGETWGMNLEGGLGPAQEESGMSESGLLISNDSHC